MNRYLLYCILPLTFIFKTSYSQELMWKSGFFGFFDNREYFNEYAQPQSILGARTFVESGFALDENNEFSVGIDFMYEFGSKPDSRYLKPILYFHHNNEPTELYMGAFSRHNLVSLPQVLQSDTFNYYKPNVEGIYLSFHNSWGSQNIWLDWTSRQTLENRETFLIGATGKATNGRLFAKYDFLMYHYAGTATFTEGPAKIRDNGGLTAIVGVNLSKFTPLDSLSISSGFIGSYDRLRTVYNLTYYYGSLSEFYAEYKAIAVRSTMYFGEGQINMVGDKMYQSPIYNRTDIIVDLFRKGRVKGCFELAFHFIPSITDFSQKFTVYLDISGRKKL